MKSFCLKYQIRNAFQCRENEFLTSYIWILVKENLCRLKLKLRMPALTGLIIAHCRMHRFENDCMAVCNLCKNPLSLLRAFREFILPISPWWAGFMPGFSVRVVEHISNQAVSFRMSAGQHWMCDNVNFSPNFVIFSSLVTLIWPWKIKVCNYGM